MKKKFDENSYKKRLIAIWDEVAPRYHKRFAGKNAGPFKASAKLIDLAKIKRGDSVLDIACGTGALTKKISKKIGSKGFVVGTDASQNAIKIAKKWSGSNKNVDFFVGDAEKLFLDEKFDVITCQYGIFFFPNAPTVLKNLREHLKKNGTIAICVHGDKDTVPFFSVILDAVTKFIPDYVPPGTPNFDRYGNKKALQKLAKNTGFNSIKVCEFVFSYSPGTFSDYWENYLKYVAKPIRKKLDSLPKTKLKGIREIAKKNSMPFIKKGKIVFPWKILILTAKV